MIYAFGNSHVHFFTDSAPGKYGKGEKENQYFQSFSLGPIIAYNFSENYNQRFSEMINMLNELPITTDDYILLVVGEVDCRWHLLKQAEIQHLPVKEVVHNCIDRFFRVHLYLKENGYNVIAWGSHPSTTSGHNDDMGCPVYGDCLTRNSVSLEWSDYLEKKCIENDIRFVSIIKDLINDNGLTKMEYYKDYCHLDPDKYLPIVIEKFKKEGIIK